MRHLPTVISSLNRKLRKKGFEVVAEYHDARAVYRLKGPPVTSLLDDIGSTGTPSPQQQDELPSLSNSEEREVEGQAFEVRDFHVANPEDPAEILSSFRNYAGLYGFKRVPITPDWSRLLLKLNRLIPEGTPGAFRRNRRIPKAKLVKYSQDFRAGAFFYTNVGIGFDVHGMLTDGQSRLTACRDTGITFEADVCFDLPEEAFAVVDSRMSTRTNGDIATMVGVSEYANVMVAAVGHLYRRDNDTGSSRRLDPREIIQALHDYDVIAPDGSPVPVKPGAADLRESVTIAVRIGIPGAKSIYAAVHYAASLLDKRMADQMFEDLKSGAGLDPDDSVLSARNRILRQFSSPANEFRGPMGEKRLRVLLSRAFNYRMKGQRAAKMMIDADHDDWPGD